MTSWHSEAFRIALKALGEGPPKDIVVRALPDAVDLGETLDAQDLTDAIAAAKLTDPFLVELGLSVHRWDAAPKSEAWTEGTKPSSEERRALICRKLGLNSEGAKKLLYLRPIFNDHTIVIAERWEQWYSPQRADERSFYWSKYREYLLFTKKWPEQSVTSLGIASSEVIRRLADPISPRAYQSKGLVVGYVQSGKTANFTGVAAKAIDAGYRLVIVMTGTIEMLRAQTQRRMDMELVGRQNIVGDLTSEQAIEQKLDYQHDAAWLDGQFLDLGDGVLLTPIHRLTRHHKDYQRQFLSMRFEAHEYGRPLFDPENLFRTGARLAIVKKNATVLRKLVNDITANKKAFAEVPVLIIDDESDQASVNTVDPEKVRSARRSGEAIADRKAINEKIATMLELMPRAQYVGYTATPFANVFCDPSDPEGIFPKDFVIGLERPYGYMGVHDFHDLDGIDGDQPNFANSNELAYVRHLLAASDQIDEQDSELARALDMFVLTGAIKLHRSLVNPGYQFRHHTMLVHDSVSQADHRALADRVRALWIRARYSSSDAKTRLLDLYQRDVVPVSATRIEVGVPPLPAFDTIAEFIPRAISRIVEYGDNPVLVVNSDKDIQRQQQVLDFDQQSVWRILIGGAKLSRGFTVEGLTITYFRRATNMSDSLTQMGRWFGFRAGYRDLVRLYIAKYAKFGRETVDLYAAFESVARDESAFREQLQMYATWEGDKPLVRPIEIPPLVMQHLPWLQPTAKNKMFNAVLDEQGEQAFAPNGYSNAADELKSNLVTWGPAFSAATELRELPRGEQTNAVFDAFVGRIDASALIEMVRRTFYLPFYGDRTVVPKAKFYERLISDGLLQDFVLIVPQPETSQLSSDPFGIGPRAVVIRDRREGRGGKFGEVTDNKHRWAALSFVSGSPAPALRHLHSARSGAVLLYLMREMEKAPTEPLVVGFSVYIPQNCLLKGPQVLRFRVRDPDRSDQAIVVEPGAVS